jgi:hypothetical protein
MKSTMLRSSSTTRTFGVRVGAAFGAVSAIAVQI